MIQAEYEKEMQWYRENMFHVDNSVALNIRSKLLKSINSIYERYGYRPNAVIISENFVDPLYKATFIERDFRSDRMIFEGCFRVYTTHEPNVLTAIIRLEVSDD